MWTRCAAPCARTPLGVIAVIDAPRVVERILRHLGVWHDPPPRPPPHGPAGGSRVSAGKGISGAVPAIGNEPGRGTLPVVSAILILGPAGSLRDQGGGVDGM